MTLKEHIDDIQIRLEQNEYPNEAAVRQGIIERLLGVLAWPVSVDTKIVYPEYGIEGRKVDYALCDTASTPRVFIEVKRVGKIDKGTKQLFEYAFHTGVPIVILTDGQKWRFFHPAGEGSYEDRKVADLDLIVGNSDECAESLNRYLNYESVKIGKAAEVIAEDYRNIVNQRQIEERLPEVWNELLQEKNDYLLLAMMEKAKEKVGHGPTEEQVLTFLKNLSIPPVKSRPIQKKYPKKPQQGKKKLSPFKRLHVTMHDGQIIDYHNAKDTFVEVIEELGLEEVMHVRPQDVSTEPFYPNREDRKSWSVQRGPFHIKTHCSSSDKERILKSIAKQLGVQLKVELVEK